MSYIAWVVAAIVIVAIVLFALTFFVPQHVSGILLLKRELKQRGVPYEHLPDAFFEGCIDWADKLSGYTGHGTTVKKRAEFVRAIENLANMVQLWRREPDSPMFAVHGDRPSTYRTLFERYDLRRGI